MAHLSPDELQYQIDNIKDDRRGAVEGATIVCAVLSYIFVILRFAAHKKGGTKLKLDDWAILVSLLLATAQYVDVVIGVDWGLGRHLILITSSVNFGKNLLAAEILYIWAIASVKIAIILLWHRLFPSKGFRIAIWTTFGLLILMTLIGTIVILLQCIPISRLWIASLPARCINMPVATTVFGALNILTDLLLILLPVQQLMKLRLETRDKIQLVALFLTGGLVTIISAARIVYTIQMGEHDITWTYVDAGIWSSAEIATAIISACLPTLRPLFAKKKDGRMTYPSNRDTSGRRSQMWQIRGESEILKDIEVAKAGAVARAVPNWRDNV